MRTFDLLTPEEALTRLYRALDEAGQLPQSAYPIVQGALNVPVERIATATARNRVLARDILAPTPLPEFRRSTVDGYAVRAASTPGVLRVIGEVRMGELTSLRVRLGDAVIVHTGGNVPEGADAVLMVEHARPIDQTFAGKIQTQVQLAPGDNIILEGEDVKAGEVVIPAGTRLREPEIGGLLSFGILEIPVTRRPRIALIASGDEVVPAYAVTRPGQVRNINTPMLAALIERHGGIPLDFGILPDRLDAFEQAAARAMHEADGVVFMAGSSMSERDFTPEVVNHMGKPGILVHGIAFRPGKPTLFAVCDGKPVFGLPGNPISALVTGMMFVVPTLWRMQGALNPPPPATVEVELTQEVKSPRELEHWFPVRLTGDGRAEPVPSKSNLIFSLSRASALVCAPIGVERLLAGARVQARLLD
ncbi:MAG: molybdopterin molybdotransferase MoeA [Anaerolineae bacterium]|nr:molybdopterin molybdotransferase MoeA [Thermoflexales bacterium]MDW8406233.1 molybdopterin molybdotransferase MoeA [Anaerolineae bacterium]